MSGYVLFYPPGPCPFLANLTRSSGVKSVNRRVGSGGRSTWSGLGGRCGFFKSTSRLAFWPCGVLRPAPRLNFWDAWVRQADRANHNAPAASSAAIARDRCFVFIVFLISASHLLLQRHCARISGSCLSIWNEGGEFWREAPASRNEPEPEPNQFTGLKRVPCATPLKPYPVAASTMKLLLLGHLMQQMS